LTEKPVIEPIVNLLAPAAAAPASLIPINA
jgi:hypothetical protein